MSGSSHIRSVLIGVEYRNYYRTLDVYLLFAIWMGQIQSKLIYIFVSYRVIDWPVCKLQVCNLGLSPFLIDINFHFKFRKWRP